MALLFLSLLFTAAAVLTETGSYVRVLLDKDWQSPSISWDSASHPPTTSSSAASAQETTKHPVMAVKKGDRKTTEDGVREQRAGQVASNGCACFQKSTQPANVQLRVCVLTGCFRTERPGWYGGVIYAGSVVQLVSDVVQYLIPLVVQRNLLHKRSVCTSSSCIVHTRSLTFRKTTDHAAVHGETKGVTRLSRELLHILRPLPAVPVCAEEKLLIFIVEV